MLPQKIPTNLKLLVDGDILRYEIGFAAETGWNAITEGRESIPPFDYVESLLLSRLEIIKSACNTVEVPLIFLTEGKTFRYDIAKTKPYKGTRVENKPWHYKNITAYLTNVLNAEVVTHIEADDRIAILQSQYPGQYVICSRDKDLKQIPGWFYSWELGRQPSFGPYLIEKQGTVELSADHKKLISTGLAAFYGQVLTGDRVDNIPGLAKCGPVEAYRLLSENPENMYQAVRDAYDNDELLLEQGQLCWLVRRLNQDGSPELWRLGQEE